MAEINKHATQKWVEDNFSTTGIDSVLKKVTLQEKKSY